MTSPAFDLIITGDQEVRRRLDAIVQFARRPRLAMQAIAQTLETITDSNFEAEGRPAWPELSEATIFQRIGGAKGYYTTKKGEKKLRKAAQRTMEALKILQDTGKLAGSVHGDAGDDWASIGAWGPYARIQQLGGEAGRGHQVTLPARPYLPFRDGKLQPEAEKAVLDTSLRELRRAAEG